MSSSFRKNPPRPSAPPSEDDDDDSKNNVAVWAKAEAIPLPVEAAAAAAATASNYQGSTTAYYSTSSKMTSSPHYPQPSAPLGSFRDVVDEEEDAMLIATATTAEATPVMTTTPTASATTNMPPLVSETTTILTNENPIRGLGRYPCLIICPYCHQETLTRTRDIMGCTAVVAVLLLLFLCCPLAILPFCCPACKATDHYCRCCHKRIARVEPCSSGQ